MKKLIALGLALSLALGGVTPISKVAEPTKAEAAGFTFTKEQTDVVAYVNKIRKTLGLKEVKLNPFLNKAAENHANYLNLNGTTSGHEEKKGNKGFTGAYHYDRVRAVGGSSDLADSTTEIQVARAGSFSVGVDAFMKIAYHRAPLVNPNSIEIGVAFKSGTMVILTSTMLSSEQKGDSVYPYNNQTGVDVEFWGHTERPNPLEKFKIEKSGFIISYFVPIDHYIEKLDSVKITDSKGKSIPFFTELHGVSICVFVNSNFRHLII
jgi:uncharacterized protein YkwD